MSESLQLTGILIFALYYIGIAIGRFPGLAIDRTGIALLGGMMFIHAFLDSAGIDFYSPAFLAAMSVILSNLVSNVPAVVLLMADWPEHQIQLAYLLSVTSTFAGNLILIVSIANLIVAEQARRQGIIISFSAHFRWTFLPALVSILIAMAWWYMMIWFSS